MLDLPGLLYFQNGGVYKGSAKGTRYKISPEDDKLTVEIWLEPYCYEKTEILETVEFELNDGGRSEMVEWLENRIKG
nr:MAG TPA: hypothetical protein [Caudoviricetes sp.]DAZ17149.1 MAG TPA: hypothetical protein [Caudoviricetes sp.]